MVEGLLCCREPEDGLDVVSSGDLDFVDEGLEYGFDGLGFAGVDGLLDVVP